MNPESFLNDLRKLGFFEGFPEQAQADYSSQIKRELEKQLSSPNAEYYAAYPGLSLVAARLEMTLDSVETDIEEIAEGSFGLFDPQEIQVVGDPDTPTLEFMLGSEQHSFTGDVATFPFRCFDFAASRMGRDCQLVRPHAIVHPSDAEFYFVIFCSPNALSSLEKSNFIPLDREEIQSRSFMDWDSELGWEAG